MDNLSDTRILVLGQKDPALTEGMVTHVLSSEGQCHLNFDVSTSGLMARILLASPTKQEVDALASNKATLYAINHRGLLIGLLDLGGGFQLEFNFNATGLTRDEWDLCRSMVSSGQFGGLSLCMTDIVTGKIVGLRFCSLSPAMTRFVYRSILDQEPTQGFDPAFVRSLLEDFWATYPDVSSLRSVMPIHCRLGSSAG